MKCFRHIWFAGALTANPDLAQTWFTLGKFGGGWIQQNTEATFFSETMCYKMAVLRMADDESIQNETYAKAWNNAAAMNGLIENLTKQEHYILALQLDSTLWQAWANLAQLGNVQLGTNRLAAFYGKTLSAKQCYFQALQLNPHDESLWFNLGNAGGMIGQFWWTQSPLTRQQTAELCASAGFQVQRYSEHYHREELVGVYGLCVIAEQYTPVYCYARAVESNTLHWKAWNNLGVAGGGEVHGVKYTEVECYQRALAAVLDLVAPHDEFGNITSRIWYNLGNAGGGVVDAEEYSRQACYEKAVKFNPLHAQASVRPKSLEQPGSGNSR